MLSGEGGIEPPTRSLELTILPLNYSPYWLLLSSLHLVCQRQRLCLCGTLAPGPGARRAQGRGLPGQTDGLSLSNLVRLGLRGPGPAWKGKSLEKLDFPQELTAVKYML